MASALKTIRKTRGLTQVALAAKAGLTQPTLSAIETGKNANPSWRLVRRISAALDVRPELAFPDDVPAS